MTEHRAPNSSGKGSASRVPPHNLDAEASALGAAMLSIGAAETIVSILTPGDFYRPAHQHIFAALCRLLADEAPHVDVVTLGDQLRRDGTLDDVGGTAYVHELQNATPAISAAGRYARIVKDAAILRRLIYTASSIAELGYNAGTEDPSSAVARAGELLSQMDAGDVRSLSTLEVADMAALLASDLQPEQPSLLVRSDGGALLYAGKMHTFQAEPSSGKSWVALVAVVEVLAMGGAAGYLDFEDTPVGIATRLLQLGAAPTAIAERFYYAQPVGKFGPAERLDLQRALERMNLDLVVIDGVGESLSREGLSEDKADDVIRWTDLLPRPIARTGAAVLMLDHVAKDPEQRGRWARGSGAKLAAVDGVVYQLKVRTSFSRHRAGRLDMIVAKDRPGGVGAIGETVASITVTPHGGGERVVVAVDPHTAEQASTDTWKPTILMGKVFAALSESSSPLTATQLSTMVHSEKPRLVKESIARLIQEGYIAETGKRPKVLRVVRPYDGAPSTNGHRLAPAWREEPPPALFDDDYSRPSSEELAEIEQQREASGFYNSDHF